MTIQFSRWLAIVGGIVTPLLETIRRWSTWQQSPANLFDDYIMGAKTWATLCHEVSTTLR